ncbi:MAG: hypothetical protein GVY18_08450 [Bacteroidetes bacterium]|jgi:hypothetical protein|nr:hypothetical protein [Bacteroidota bacterium]
MPLKPILFILLAVLLMSSAPLRAQSLELDLLFESEPGVRPGALLDGFTDASSPKRFDADGDGQADLILRRENEQGGLQDLRVLSELDKSSPKIIWEVRDVPATLGITSPMDLWGFGDVDADGQPEAIFYDDNQVSGFHIYRNNLSWKVEEGEAIRLVGATDLTGNGFQEIVVTLQDTRRVQVWKAPAGKSLKR